LLSLSRKHLLLPGFFNGAPGGARFQRGAFSEGWFAEMQLVGAVHLQRGCIRSGGNLPAEMNLTAGNHPRGRKELVR